MLKHIQGDLFNATSGTSEAIHKVCHAMTILTPPIKNIGPTLRYVTLSKKNF